MHEITSKNQVVRVCFRLIEAVDRAQEIPVGRELRELDTVQLVLSLCDERAGLSVPLDLSRLAGLLTVASHLGTSKRCRRSAVRQGKVSFLFEMDQELRADYLRALIAVNLHRIALFA